MCTPEPEAAPDCFNVGSGTFYPFTNTAGVKLIFSFTPHFQPGDIPVSSPSPHLLAPSPEEARDRVGRTSQSTLNRGPAPAHRRPWPLLPPHSTAIHSVDNSPRSFFMTRRGRSGSNPDPDHPPGDGDSDKPSLGSSCQILALHPLDEGSRHSYIRAHFNRRFA